MILWFCDFVLSPPRSHNSASTCPIWELPPEIIFLLSLSWADLLCMQNTIYLCWFASFLSVQGSKKKLVMEITGHKIWQKQTSSSWWEQGGTFSAMRTYYAFLCHWNMLLFHFKLINHSYITYVHWIDLENQTCPCYILFIKTNHYFLIF